MTMNSKQKKTFFKRLAAVVTAMFTVTAGAQSNDTENDEAFVIEEVIVTAQKREQSIQDVPISIVAFGEDMLIAIGADSLDDMTRRTPNVNYEKQDDVKLSTPNIRGVFGSNTGGTEMSVGMYLDEVIMGTSVAGAVNLFDLERVEILRGPQGTLFGRNTTGGAMSYTTKKPTMELLSTDAR